MTRIAIKGTITTTETETALGVDKATTTRRVDVDLTGDVTENVLGTVAEVAAAVAKEQAAAATS